MAAMGCSAAPIQAPQLSSQKYARLFTTAAPLIARKRYSYTDCVRAGLWVELLLRPQYQHPQRRQVQGQ